ncbi:MAG TPA: M3 family oligoendopeptidase, partial [Chthonomonadales bacterium]|nr:M3 family oligoendopeptidase [Chthonomonadales bacterium]
MRLAERSDVAPEHKWSIDSIFANGDEWEAANRSVDLSLGSFTAYHGKLQNSPEDMLNWFDTYFKTAELMGKIATYAHMQQSVESSDQEAVARLGKATALQSRFLSAVAFAEPEILEIGQERLREWMEEAPRLRVYEHFFELLEARRPHVRSAEVEELLGSLGGPFYGPRDIHGTLSNTDLSFSPAVDSAGEKLEVAQGTIGQLLHHPEECVRKSAWENYADAYVSMKNTAAACISAGIRQDVFRANARRYRNSLEAALAPSHIPVEVFYNLIQTFQANLPTWHRYWQIRSRALEQAPLEIWNTRAPLTVAAPQVPFLQAVDWISQGLAPLGENYVDAMRSGVLEQRWVDIYPNRHKRMGAYSSGVQGTHPFVFMSYTEDLFGLSTLAHELGHSMHSYSTWASQPPVYARYSLFVAEVASNFNQAMTRAHLLETSDDPDFQIAVIEEAMANFGRYLFTMPTLARFELEMHERIESGDALTADLLSARMAALFREAYGPGVRLDEDRVGITWAQFPTHLYSNF